MKVCLKRLFVFAVSLPTIVTGNFIVRVLLNFGKPLSTDETCTLEEWNHINATITTVSQNQRRVLLTDNDSSNGIKSRNLRFYPPTCRNNCRGFTKGSCLAINCKGYGGRFLRGLDDTNENTKVATTGNQDKDRDLFYATSCNNQKSELKNWLNNLANEVSYNCSKLLKAQRNMTCFDDLEC
jgi:hypothetical protein